MKKHLKGIIDQKLFERAFDFGIQEVSFDLRPTSFNFTQGYVIEKILEDSSTDFESYSVLFDTDKDFMVLEQLKKIENATPVDVFPEFSNLTDIDALDRIGKPFAWQYNQATRIKSILESKNLQRIVFTFSELEVLLKANEFFGLVNLLREVRDFDIELLVDWDSPIYQSVLETVENCILSFEINNKIESSYRNIDYNLLEAHIHHIAKSQASGVL